MRESASVATDLEMMALDRAVRAVLDLEIPEDILLDSGDDSVVDGDEDSLRPFGGEVDLVVAVVASELEMVEGDVFCADLGSAPLHFGPKKTGFISFRPVRCRIDSGVDDEDGL